MSFPGRQQLENLETSQRNCHEVTADVLDEMSDLVEKALCDVRSGSPTVVKDLAAQLKSCKVVKRAATATRDFHSAIRDFGSVSISFRLASVLASCVAECKLDANYELPASILYVTCYVMPLLKICRCSKRTTAWMSGRQLEQSV